MIDEEMARSEKKTHIDYVDIIGRTRFDARTYREKRYNQYYFLSYLKAVKKLLRGDPPRGAILDVGCSYGSWFQVWKKMGFSTIDGVEISPERARLAEKTGYRNVFCCDAQNMPIGDNRYDVGCSNDMFVHLLHIPDKIKVLNECYRVLKPGGIFLFNFPTPLAFSYGTDTIVEYCSFYSLDTMIRDVVPASNFRLEDIAISYFYPYNLLSRLAWRIITVPLTVTILRLNDFLFSSRLPIQKSATLYFKLRREV